MPLKMKFFCSAVQMADVTSADFWWVVALQSTGTAGTPSVPFYYLGRRQVRYSRSPAHMQGGAGRLDAGGGGTPSADAASLPHPP